VSFAFEPVEPPGEVGGWVLVSIPPSAKAESASLAQVIITAEDLDRDPLLLERTPFLLMLCRYREDVSWLKSQPYPAIVYEKDYPSNQGETRQGSLPVNLHGDRVRARACSGKHGVPYNVAGEASAFLKFIVDYHDRLPERTLFLHSHR
jgi:hypothetical protein